MLPLLFLVSCGPRSPEDCRSRGENLTRKLIAEFEQIQTKQDLREHLPKLRVLYEKIADLVIKAEKNLDVQQLSEHAINEELNEQLKRELVRVYQIDGARELIERAQVGALAKLALWDEKKAKMIQKIS